MLLISLFGFLIKAMVGLSGYLGLGRGTILLLPMKLKKFLSLPFLSLPHLFSSSYTGSAKSLLVSIIFSTVSRSYSLVRTSVYTGRPVCGCAGDTGQGASTIWSSTSLSSMFLSVSQLSSVLKLLELESVSDEVDWNVKIELLSFYVFLPISFLTHYVFIYRFSIINFYLSILHFLFFSCS